MKDKVTIHTLKRQKQAGQKICMVTAYDATFARLFDDATPEHLAHDAVPGVRNHPPLRTAGRMVEGYLVELGEPDASDRPLSELEAVVSPVPVLTPRLYALARRCADRAAGSASDILRLAIPRRMVRAEKAWLAAGAPVAAEVAPEAHAWATAALGGHPGLDEAIERGERLAVDAPPAPAAGSTLDAGSARPAPPTSPPGSG